MRSFRRGIIAIILSITWCAPNAVCQPQPRPTLEDVKRLVREYEEAAKRGDFSTALQRIQEAYRIRTDLDPHDFEIADDAGAIANVLVNLGRDHEAIPYYKQALETTEARLGPEHVDLVQILNDYAAALQNTGDYDAPIGLLRRSLAILTGSGQAETELAAVALTRLADVLTRRHDFRNALVNAEQAVRLNERLTPINPLHLADALNIRGIVYQNRTNLTGAQADFERAITLTKTNEVALARCLHNLGYVLELQGRYAEARRIDEHGLEIRERKSGPGHPSTSTIRGNLANVLQHLGDLSTARQLYETSIEYQRKVLGKHPDLAVLLGNYADLLTAQKQYEEAQKHYQEAIDMVDAPSMILLRDSIVTKSADSLQLAGKFDAAERLLRSELELQKDKLGPDDPAVGSTMNSLGRIFIFTGRLDEAVAAVKRALEICESTQGPDNPQTALLHLNLAVTYAANRQTDLARSEAAKSAKILQTFLEDTAPELSFAEQQHFLSGQWTDYISLILSIAPSRLSEQESDAVLYSKGIVIELLARYKALDTLARNADYTARVERLRTVRLTIAALRRTPAAARRPDYEDVLRTFTHENEQLQREVAPALSAHPITPVTSSLVRNKLRPDEALVDFYVYNHTAYNHALDPKSTEFRYVALIMTSAGQPVLVRLGPATLIDSQVAQWRDHRQTSDTREWQILANTLWRPLATALPRHVTRIWISPDGSLGLLPWSLFPETVRATRNIVVTQTDSAHEFLILRSRSPASVEDHLLVVGGIDYDVAGQDRATDIYFQAQKSMREEATDIVRIASDEHIPTTWLHDQAAMKAAVLDEMQRATYLHFATHGFFLAPDHPLREDQSSTKGAPTPANILAEAGLALAGANVIDENGKAAGILTAEEFVGRDLRHVNLIALSACDTGVGSLIVRQGVIGLRGAIMSSGPRTLLLSLWKVPSEATRELMTSYYVNLWRKKMPKAKALAEAQRSIRRDKRFHAPENWAGWAIVGEAW